MIKDQPTFFESHSKPIWLSIVENKTISELLIYRFFNAPIEPNLSIYCVVGGDKVKEMLTITKT